MALRYNIHLSLAFRLRHWRILHSPHPRCEIHRESTLAGICPLSDKEEKETRRPCKMLFCSASKRRHHHRPITRFDGILIADDFLHLDWLCADRSINSTLNVLTWYVIAFANSPSRENASFSCDESFECISSIVIQSRGSSLDRESRKRSRMRSILYPRPPLPSPERQVTFSRVSKAQRWFT